MLVGVQVSPKHHESVAEKEQIDLIAELRAGIMPSVLSVRLWLGKKRAVRVTPEWKLPELDSDEHPLLHLTVAYLPPRGKYPVRVELWDANKGMVAHLSTVFDVVSAHELVNSPKEQPFQEDKYVPPPPDTMHVDEEESGEEDEGWEERDDRSMFCSRRQSLDSGDQDHVFVHWRILGLLLALFREV